MNTTVKCDTCEKTFSKNITSSKGLIDKDAQEHTCYSCTLEKLTDGRPPEEGDFNTAAITSGEMSDDERRWLQEDLRMVEHGSTRRIPIEEEQELYNFDEDDDRDDRFYHEE